MGFSQIAGRTSVFFSCKKSGKAFRPGKDSEERKELHALESGRREWIEPGCVLRRVSAKTV
jgi:hypothetical protein